MKSHVVAAVALAASSISHVQAFQSSPPMVLSAYPARQMAPFATTISSGQRQQKNTSMNMIAMGRNNSEAAPGSQSSLFQRTSTKTRAAVQRLRRSFTILLASFAFFLSSTRVMSTPPAHAASAATAASTTSLSLAQKLNPFRTKSADEMIDAYVRDRLFADDVYDPVESAYREAFADAGSGGSKGSDGSATSSGAYPTLLAETAGAALGQQRSVSSLVSSSGASSRGLAGSSSGMGATDGKNDGITAVLIKASDLLQSKLKVSASVSYYILAGGGLMGVCVLPGMVGVLYQGLQRLQIDKSEMKMYGKITDMDATSKKVTDDDDDDEEE